MQVLSRKEHKSLTEAHSESGDSDVSFGSTGRQKLGTGLLPGLMYPQSLPYGCGMPSVGMPLCSNNNVPGAAPRETPGPDSKMARLDGRQLLPTQYLAAANNLAAAQLQSMSMNAAAAVALQNAATAAFLAHQPAPPKSEFLPPLNMPPADPFYRSAASLSPQSLSHLQNRASTESMQPYSI